MVGHSISSWQQGGEAGEEEEEEGSAAGVAAGGDGVGCAAGGGAAARAAAGRRGRSGGSRSESGHLRRWEMTFRGSRERRRGFGGGGMMAQLVSSGPVCEEPGRGLRASIRCRRRRRRYHRWIGEATRASTACRLGRARGWPARAGARDRRACPAPSPSCRGSSGRACSASGPRSLDAPCRNRVTSHCIAAERVG